MKKNYQDIPQRLISAVIKSNERKRVIANEITNLASGVIGFFKINMKKDSDNFRESSVIDIIKLLKNDHNKKIIIYEPLLDPAFFESFEIVNDFNEFVTKSDLIVSNRMYPELNNTQKSLYARYLFRELNMIKLIDKLEDLPYVEFYNLYELAISKKQKYIESSLISTFDINDNQPNSRYVNIKYIKGDEWIFFTNLNFCKG